MVIPLSERKLTETSKTVEVDASTALYDGDLHSYGAREPYRGSIKKGVKEEEITPLTQPYEGILRSRESPSSLSSSVGGDRSAVTPLAGPYAGVSHQPGSTGLFPSRVVTMESFDDESSDTNGNSLIEEIRNKVIESYELQETNHRLLTKTFQQPHHTFFEEVFHDSVLVLSWMKFLYKLLGSFPLLGPWLQCVFLLNVFCAILLLTPSGVREAIIIPLISAFGLLLKIFFYPLGYYMHRVILSPHMSDIASFFKSIAVDAVSEAFYLVGKGAMTLTGSDYLLNTMREMGITTPVAVEPHSFDFLEAYLPLAVVETAKKICPGC